MGSHLLEGRPDSVGNLFHHIATAGQVGSLEPSTVLIGAATFQLTPLLWQNFHGASSMTIRTPDHFLQETTFFLHYLSKWGFTVIRLRVGMFMNLADLNGKLNIGNTTTFEKLSTNPL